MDNNFFTQDASKAQTVQETVVPPQERKQYIAGIVLGALGFVAAFFIPIIGLALSVAGLVLTGKHKNTHHTKIALIVCILGIISGIGNWIYGIIVVMPQMMEQLNTMNAAQ